MYTVKETITNELIIKNSRFITLLYNFNDPKDLDNILNNIKSLYPKATHCCYAYITESSKKSSDDKEPGGTAGIPMLSVLDKNNIINTLAVTVRYFGGIKLGSGGLVRAYSKSVREALNKEKLLELEKGYNVKIITAYDKQKDLDYLLKDYEITNKNYNEQITYEVNIPIDKINLLKNYNCKIEKELYIKKETQI